MFDLTLLTEFNEALVYGFSPETVPIANNFEQVFSKEVYQYHDMYKAYLYAQAVILPQIKADSWQNISSEQLLEWIKKLHLEIGNSLLNFSGQKSGEFTQNIIFRYHQGAELNTEFALYLSGLHQYKNKSEFVARLEKIYKLSAKNSRHFINILEKIKDDPEYTIAPHEEALIDKTQPTSIGVSAIAKLGTAYINDKFSEKTKTDIEKIMSICNPHTINIRMTTWSEWTLKSLRELDPKDTIKLCSFLADMFYQLTEIHPFVNANGRTATCFLNIVLRSFNLPSIVLRHPHEKGDNKSLYARAFDQFNKSTKNLQELILLRLKEAQSIPFKDEQLKKLVIVRVTFNDLISEFKQKNTDFSISEFITDFNFNKSNNEKRNLLQASKGLTQDQISYETILLMLAFLNSYIKDQKTSLTHSFTFFGTSPKLTTIQNQLETITQISPWKLNAKECDAYWIRLPSKAEAQKTQALLEKLVIAGEIKCEQIKNSTEAVLICKKVISSRLAYYADKYTETKTTENQLVIPQ
mgnify:CR=1 FL=1